MHARLSKQSTGCHARGHANGGLHQLRSPISAAGRQGRGLRQQIVEGSTYEEVLDKLSSEALQAALQLPDNQQYIIGIAGCPGSGKSTLAREVARRVTEDCRSKGLSRTAVVAPMDGFHYYRKQLDQMPNPKEASARRGAPWTFDADAFVAAIMRIRQQGAACLPSFDHGVGDPVEEDIAIDSQQHAVVLVEGNYLFLESEPWVHLRDLFDDTWFVDCPLDTAMQRVFERQTAIGLAPDVSWGRIMGNDRPNGELVDASKGAARVLVPSSIPFADCAPSDGTTELAS